MRKNRTSGSTRGFGGKGIALQQPPVGPTLLFFVVSTKTPTVTTTITAPPIHIFFISLSHTPRGVRAPSSVQVIFEKKFRAWG